MTTKFVPKLRFSGFSGEWEEKTLEAISTFISKKIPLSQVSLDNYKSTENLLADFGGTTKSLKLPNCINITEFKVNDVLMSNIRPYLKKIWLANIVGGSSNDIIITRVIGDNNYKFLFYIVQNDRFIDYVMRGAKGVKMPRGDIPLIKKYPLALPKPKEQQKIANCLNSLDNLIEVQNKKVEALAKYKKGLMQKLFPTNDEKIPKLRFKGFSEEWEGKKLGEITTFLKGKGLPKKVITKNAKYQCVHYGELFTNYQEVIQNIKSYTNDNKNTFLSISNDVLMPTSDVTPNGLAKASCIKSSNVILGGDILVIRTGLFGEFLSRYIRFLENEILKLVSGTTVFHLYSSNMEKLKLCIPTLPEQQKIADSLSSLDNLIEVQNKNIQILKTHKKGLMQQLFVSENK
jgi:type I restriction enzyme S subunit